MPLIWLASHRKSGNTWMRALRAWGQARRMADARGAAMARLGYLEEAERFLANCADRLDSLCPPRKPRVMR